MNDTVVWTAETNEFVLLDSAPRDAAVQKVRDFLRGDRSGDAALSEEGRRSLLRWADPLRA